MAIRTLWDEMAEAEAAERGRTEREAAREKELAELRAANEVLASRVSTPRTPRSASAPETAPATTRASASPTPEPSEPADDPPEDPPLFPKTAD